MRTPAMPVGVTDQFDRAGLGDRLDVAIEQAAQQTGDQRGTGDAEVGVGIVVDGVNPGASFGIDADIAEIRWEGGDPVFPGAELAPIHRARAQRPPAARPPAGQLGLVIGKALGDGEAQLAVFLDEIEHCRAGPHEGVHQIGVHVAQRLGLQIVDGVGDRQWPVGAAVVGRYPHDAAGDRGGAAHRGRLLVDRDRGAVDRRGQRGGESGATAAQDDDVDLGVPVDALVPAGLVDSVRVTSFLSVQNCR